MKRKPSSKVRAAKVPVLNEAAAAYDVGSEESQPMVRTQIYLTPAEHSFLQSEAARRAEPMAAVIRSFVDEKMEVPEEAWTRNPMLEPPVHDPDWKGHEDGAINHDHYIHGSPRKWMKRNGQWVETPPLPADYYSNPESRRRYDEEVNRST